MRTAVKLKLAVSWKLQIIKIEFNLNNLFMLRFLFPLCTVACSAALQANKLKPLSLDEKHRLTSRQLMHANLLTQVNQHRFWSLRERQRRKAQRNRFLHKRNKWQCSRWTGLQIEVKSSLRLSRVWSMTKPKMQNAFQKNYRSFSACESHDAIVVKIIIKRERRRIEFSSNSITKALSYLRESF